MTVIWKILIISIVVREVRWSTSELIGITFNV